MNQQHLVFDYQSGTIRRDLSTEGPKHIFKNTTKKVASPGVLTTVRNLFGRK
ncbi:MAG: hypothetical protein ACI9EW_000630 [Cellvibrionaceae bacterium]|jgi:hypothetical protein